MTTVSDLTPLSSDDSRGFFIHLMEVITKVITTEMDTDARISASDCFKDIVSKNWRQWRCIDSGEKENLKRMLLSQLQEKNDKIAHNLATAISKIARLDYPLEWPELIRELTEKNQTADALTSHRILMILFRISKELSTKRLPHDQREFAKIAFHLLGTSRNLWLLNFDKIFSCFKMLAENAPEQNHDLYLSCEKWFLCTKMIRQLIIFGLPSDIESTEEVRQFVKLVCSDMWNAVQNFLPYYSSIQERDPKFWKFLKKACTKLLKILVAFQQKHPYTFCDQNVIKPVVQFCLSKITNTDDVSSCEDVLIQCMLMMKSVLECEDYKKFLNGPDMDDNQISNEDSDFVGVLASLLPKTQVVQLFTVLICRYLVLTVSDLKELDQNPELYQHKQDTVLFSKRLRSCTIALCIVLLKNRREDCLVALEQPLVPMVNSNLQRAIGGCSNSIDILLKDAAYGAAAYAYKNLEQPSFKELFDKFLSVELNSDDANMWIIHRKVAIILGDWVSKIKDDTRQPVYLTLTKLLQKKQLCVRLAASRSLCIHIEDKNFSKRDFTIFFPTCWASCLKLLEEVGQCDSIVQVLKTICGLISHFSENIPDANVLVPFFQKAWKEPYGERLLQIQLFTALKTQIVPHISRSPHCYCMLMLILESVINENSPHELMEDSLELWEATLTHATSMEPMLLEYFPCLFKLLDRSLNHIKVTVSIIEGYILLDGFNFIVKHEKTLAKILDLVVGNVNDEGLLSILPLVDILVQCFLARGPQLISTTTIQKLIVICLSSAVDHDPSKTAVKTSTAAILARIWFTSTKHLTDVISEQKFLRELHIDFLAQVKSEQDFQAYLQDAGVLNEDDKLTWLVIAGLIQVWLDSADNVMPEQKKLFALALATTLDSGISVLKFHHILCVCTSAVLSEENSSGMHLSYKMGNLIHKLWKQKALPDPISTCSLKWLVTTKISACKKKYSWCRPALGNMDHESYIEMTKALE